VRCDLGNVWLGRFLRVNKTSRFRRHVSPRLFSYLTLLFSYWHCYSHIDTVILIPDTVILVSDTLILKITFLKIFIFSVVLILFFVCLCNGAIMVDSWSGMHCSTGHKAAWKRKFSECSIPHIVQGNTRSLLVKCLLGMAGMSEVMKTQS
jgi:hypothetical protein